MGIGQKFQKLFSGGPQPEGDPGAMVEAGVVPLAAGPMEVERLRDAGIEAVGIESIDPVTEVRSHMRVMVRQADLPVARRVLDERPDDAGAAEGLDELAGADLDEEDALAEEAAAETMSALFLAADRLANQPEDAELATEIEALRADVAGTAPPFGVEVLAWERMAALAEAVGTADQAADEDEVRGAAVALRDFLRQYV